MSQQHFKRCLRHPNFLILSRKLTTQPRNDYKFDKLSNDDAFSAITFYHHEKYSYNILHGNISAHKTIKKCSKREKFLKQTQNKDTTVNIFKMLYTAERTKFK